MDQWREDVIAKNLDTGRSHIDLLDTDAAVDRLAKIRLTSGRFMALIAAFVRRETKKSLEEQNTVVAKPSNNISVAATEACLDDIKKSKC